MNVDISKIKNLVKPPKKGDIEDINKEFRAWDLLSDEALLTIDVTLPQEL